MYTTDLSAPETNQFISDIYLKESRKVQVRNQEDLFKIVNKIRELLSVYHSSNESINPTNETIIEHLPQLVQVKQPEEEKSLIDWNKRVPGVEMGLQDWLAELWEKDTGCNIGDKSKSNVAADWSNIYKTMVLMTAWTQAIETDHFILPWAHTCKEKIDSIRKGLEDKKDATRRRRGSSMTVRMTETELKTVSSPEVFHKRKLAIKSPKLSQREAAKMLQSSSESSKTSEDKSSNEDIGSSSDPVCGFAKDSRRNTSSSSGGKYKSKSTTQSPSNKRKFHSFSPKLSHIYKKISPKLDRKAWKSHEHTLSTASSDMNIFEICNPISSQTESNKQKEWSFNLRSTNT